MWRVWRRKPLDSMRYEGDGQSLQRTFKTVDLLALGVGTTLSAGILLEVAQVSRDTAGPSIILSFLLAGFATLFTAWAFSEFAARIPVAGSSYSYTYTSLGELCGWIVGWDLSLEYILSAAIIARGMSQYLIAMFAAVGVNIPTWTLVFPYSDKPFQFDLLAAALVLITMLSTIYFKEKAARINSVNTLIAVLILVVVVCAAIPNIKSSNYTPFVPFQFYGIAKGAAILMFSYVGFDAVSIAAEEVKNPRRTVPLTIVGSIILSITLYTIISTILTGQLEYNEMNTVNALSNFFLYPYVEGGMEWIRFMAGLAAIFTVFTNIYGTIYAQSRILMSMSRDGLLWPWFGELHKKYNTPVNSTLLSGFIGAILAGFVDLSILADLVAIGVVVSYLAVNSSLLSQRYSTETSNKKVGSTVTVYIAGLFLTYAAAANLDKVHYAFLIVSAAITSIPFMLFFLFPRLNPIPIGFKCPGVPFVPLLAIAINVWILYTTHWIAWLRFGIWLGIGLFIYFIYGLSHSSLAADKKSDRFFSPSFEDEEDVFARLTGNSANPLTEPETRKTDGMARLD